MKKLLILLAIAGAIAALIYFSGEKTGEAAQVDMTQVSRQTVRGSILSSGTIAYRQQVNLRSEVIGQVDELLVEEGQPVQAGDVLLRIDPRTFRAEVEQQSANVRLQQTAIARQQLLVDNLERQVARKQTLFERKLLDQDSFEVARNDLAISRVDLTSRQESVSQARALLDQARERLSKTEIRAPISGIVTSLDVKVGETVVAGTTNIIGSSMLSLADTSDVLTEVFVDEADIAKVALGQQSDVFAVAFPDDPLTGQVESIATTAKNQPGRQGLSFLVKILISDTHGANVRPGMSARAEIFTESSEQAITIPVEAVLYDSGDPGEARPEQPYVFVVEDGTAKRRDVVLGLANDELQEITEGLDDSDTIVSGPYRELRDLRDGFAVTSREADSDESDG